MSNRSLTVALLAGCTLLGACSDGSSPSTNATFTNATGSNDAGSNEAGSNDAPIADSIAAGDGLAEIAGLWDVTRDVANGSDIRYLLIRDDGIITEFDYAQDGTGTGANCYAITSFRLNPESDGRFNIGNRTLSISRVADTLDYRFVDSDDEDGDGDVVEELAFDFPLLDGIDPGDLNSCGI